MADEETPPHHPERRSDGASRAIVQRLDAIQGRLAVMEALQASNVTHRGALLALSSVLLLAGGLGLFFLGRAEAAADKAGAPAMAVAQRAEATAERAEAKADAQERFLKTELADMKHELRGDLAELKAEVRNTSRVVERTAKRAAVATDGGP